uniref:Uncharacterized protein n=1 Tax=Arundo donax TaxID=35708 RepID=A0A0A8XPB9_ARUDO
MAFIGLKYSCLFVAPALGSRKYYLHLLLIFLVRTLLFSFV